MNKRIRVQVERDGRLARADIWQSEQPYAVGYPIRGVIEHVGDGVRFRSLGQEGKGPQAASVSQFEFDDLVDGAEVTLPGDGEAHSETKVKLQWVHELRSPYIQKQDEIKDALGRGVPTVRAYAGSSGSLISSVTVASAYVGYSRNRPVFALYRDGREFRLRALLPDLQIKYKGEAPEALPVEKEIHLKEEQLARATLIRGRYWWRMTFQHAAPLDLPEEDRARPLTFVDWGTRGAVVASIVAILWGTLISDPEVPEPPKQKEVRPSVVVKVAGRRGTPNPSSMSPVQVADTPPAPAGPTKKVEVAQINQPTKEAAPPAPAPVQKAPLVTPPKPAPAAKAAAPSKPAPVEKAATQAPPVKSAPSATEVAKARASAKAQQTASSIQSALGQFMKSSNVPGALTSTTSGAGAAGPSVSNVQGFGKANIAADSIGTGGGTTVARAGGGGSGNVAGYGAGNAGTVLGTRGGNGVALGTEGLPEEKGLTKEEVWAVIHSHANEVRYCYESALLATPNLEGQVAVEFSISPAGDVARTRIQKTTTTAKTVDDCIVSKLKTWKFPKPRGGIFVTITYPFNFKNLGRGN